MCDEKNNKKKFRNDVAHALLELEQYTWILSRFFYSRDISIKVYYELSESLYSQLVAMLTNSS
jgi:hypothetical protein